MKLQAKEGKLQAKEGKSQAKEWKWQVKEDMKMKRSKRSGVTLIEMMVVVVIIALFAALVAPRLLKQGDHAKVVAL